MKKRLAALALSIVLTLGLAPGLASGADGSEVSENAAPAVLEAQAATYLEGIPTPQANDLSITAEKDSIRVSAVGTDEYGSLSRYYLCAKASTEKEVPAPPVAAGFVTGRDTIEGLQPDTTYYVYACFMSEKITRPTATYYGNWSDPITVRTLPDGQGQGDISGKEANPMTASAKPVVFPAAKVKKADQSAKASKAFAVENAEGGVTYKVAKYVTKAAEGKVSVSKNGKVTVRKGTKAGIYKLKVKVTAAGNDSYEPKSVKVALKVVVK